MVHLPDELSAEHIRTEYKKGDVLRWELFPGKVETKDRFFILLTACDEKDEFLAVSATKRTEFYLRNDGKRRFRDYVLIKRGECFLFEKDTIIDLNWTNRFMLQEISKLLGAGIARVGSLPDDIIRRLDAKVKESRTIDEDRKKHILT